MTRIRKSRVPNRISAVLLLALLGVLLNACGWTKPPIEQDVTDSVLPETYSLYTPDTVTAVQWWTSFNSSELDTMIQQALENNPGLQQVHARLRQAEALATQAAGGRWPDLNLSAGSTQLETRKDNGADPAQQIQTTTHSIGLASSWEIDLWGRVNASANAGAQNLEASRMDHKSARQSLIAEVTLAWLNAHTAQNSLTLLSDQINRSRQLMELRELKYRMGVSTSLEVHQERAALAALQAQLPGAELGFQLAIHQLNLLMGRPAAATLELHNRVLPDLAALPATGIPAELLDQRPDLRSRGLRLNASQWQLKAARAARLPALRLTASGSYGHEEMSLFFDNWASNLAANLTMPLFQGGRLRAGVTLAEAQHDESFAAYRGAVLSAVAEVETALKSETSLRRTVSAQQAQIAATQASYQQIRQNTLLGIGDFSTMQNLLSTLQSLERVLLQSQNQLLAARVTLHRALGGNWIQPQAQETE